MYTIIKRLDGNFTCVGLLQDGTERWQEDTLKRAITSIKEFAKWQNNTKIDKNDITFLQEVVRETVLTDWDNPSA